MKLNAGTGFVLFGVTLLFAQQPAVRRTPVILGRWEGTSLCVDKATDKACKDERIVYQFDTAGVEQGALMLHAYRYWTNGLEHMVDLVLHYNDSTKSWSGDFIGRYSSRWTYSFEHNQLRGTLVDLPTFRLIRRVEAVRDSLN